MPLCVRQIVGKIFFERSGRQAVKVPVAVSFYPHDGIA